MTISQLIHTNEQMRICVCAYIHVYIYVYYVRFLVNVYLSGTVGPNILLVLTMKRQVLHRECSHLKVTPENPTIGEI